MLVMLACSRKSTFLDEDTPANGEDSAETALLKALEETALWKELEETALWKELEETPVIAVGDPSKNHGPLDLNLCLVLQAFVAPNTFVQSPNELFAIDSLLSISLLILASDETMQPK